MASIQNKVIVITGASEGIGAALAIKLAAGNKLVLAARRIEKLQEVAKQVEAAGGKAHCVACDVMEQGPVRESGG
jgi:NADP-dependent 3-hydroxy acid dehydrogenase YdfG